MKIMQVERLFLSVCMCVSVYKNELYGQHNHALMILLDSRLNVIAYKEKCDMKMISIKIFRHRE